MGGRLRRPIWSEGARGALPTRAGGYFIDRSEQLLVEDDDICAGGRCILIAGSFQVNTRIKLDGVEFRFHRLVGSSLWQLENELTGEFIQKDRETLHRLLEQGKLVFLPKGRVAQVQLTPTICEGEEFELAKLRRLYVKAVQGLPKTKAAFEPVIERTWLQTNAPSKAPSFSSVYRWVTRFEAAESDIRALLDNTAAKGNRKPRHCSEVLRCCEDSIQSVFLGQRERATLERTLDDAKIRIKAENSLRPASQQLQNPTRRLMRRLIGRISAFDRHAARHGIASARIAYRGVKAHRTTERPLERAEIDHTLLDVVVVDDETRTPISRPWLTVCMDDYSRCVLGFELSFAGPSFRTVAACLKQCFKPKTNLKETYPSLRSEWHAAGVMRELAIDNGRDFHSKSLENALLRLGIEPHFAPIKSGAYKGKVERFFGTLNRAISHRLPGTTFSNITERGDYKSDKNARISLSELREILTIWITDDYHQSFHQSLQQSPSSMWQSGIDPDEIRYVDDLTELDATLGTTYECKLTHKGVPFKGLLYNSPELQEIRRAVGEKIDVEIRVDETNLGSVYVLWPQLEKPFRVPALRREYAEGISLAQHNAYKRQRREQYRETGVESDILDSRRAIDEQVQHSRSRRRRLGPRAGSYLEDAARNSRQRADEAKTSPKQDEVHQADTLGIPGEPPTTSAPKTLTLSRTRLKFGAIKREETHD